MRRSIVKIVLIVMFTLPSPSVWSLEPDREDPHHLRMLLETTLYMVIGTAWYFSGQDLNAPDWDFEVTGDDISSKFFGVTQIRFDNNSFLFNQAYHPLAYSQIYLTGRSNDMGPYLAFAYTFGASLFWEYIGELREKVSVNDMIVSPLTGMAWGEIAHQYGEYFVSDDSTGKIAHKTLTGFFALPRLFHDWLDDEEPTRFDYRRFYPSPTAYLVGGIRHLDGQNEPLTTLAIESEMAVMPGYGQVGKRTESFTDGNFSRLRVELQYSPNQFEIDLDATGTIGGLYHRNIRPDGHGIEWMIGGGRGYRLISRDGDQLRDRFATAHIVGPTAKLKLYRPNFSVDIGTNLFIDFTAARSHAIKKFVAEYGYSELSKVRTDIQNQAYYFGWGYTFSPSVAVEIDRWRFEASTTISQVRSIQGIDRFQERVTRTIILKDAHWEAKAAIMIPTPVQLLDVRLQWHQESRISRLDELSAHRSHSEFQLGIQSRF